VVLIAGAVFTWDKWCPRSGVVPTLWCTAVPFPVGAIKDEGRRKMKVVVLSRRKAQIWGDRTIPVDSPAHINLRVFTRIR